MASTLIGKAAVLEGLEVSAARAVAPEGRPEAPAQAGAAVAGQPMPM